MAVIAAVRVETSTKIEVSWSALASGDTGAPVELPDAQDMSVQIQFIAGTTPSCQMEGSNDGTNYHLLADPQGTDIVKTASDLEAIMDSCVKWLRPNCTAGTGVNCNVIVNARRMR